MIKKNTKMIFLLIVISILFLSGYFVKKTFFHERLKETVLKDNFLISSEWNEVDTKNKVKIEKDNHYVSILLEPPYETFGIKGGIKTPNGEIVNPEIKLVDEQGKEYLLTNMGARRNGEDEYANYGYHTNLPADKVYKTVLIRCDFPIKAKQILWSGYDNKDLK